MIGQFELYLQNSLSLSVVALLIMALFPLLSRRYSANCRYYLLLVVFIALALPLRPEINITIPEGFQSEFIKNTSAAVSQTSVFSNTAKACDWQQYARLIWGLGILCFLGWHLFQHLLFLLAVKRWGEKINDTIILEQFSCVKKKLGIKDKINIKSCACIKTPMLIGLFRPVVLLPQINFTQDELPLILKHELIHYRRRDLWYRALMIVVLAIHWFNPVIHLMVRSALRLCEISCDEKVLKGSSTKIRARYGEAIINVIRNTNTYGTILSTSFYNGTKEIKNRIYAMMDTASKRTSPVLFTVILFISIGGMTAFVLSPARVQDTSNNLSQRAMSTPAPNRTTYETPTAELTPAPLDKSKVAKTTPNSNDLTTKNNESQIAQSGQFFSVNTEARIVADNENSPILFKQNELGDQSIQENNEPVLVTDNENSPDKLKQRDLGTQSPQENNEPVLVTDNENSFDKLNRIERGDQSPKENNEPVIATDNEASIEGSQYWFVSGTSRHK